MLYEKAKAPTTRLFHRTGETADQPLFATWIKLANAFRDAETVRLGLRERSS